MQNPAITPRGIVWDCGFDDINIDACHTVGEDGWDYRVRCGDVSITTLIHSSAAPHESSQRGRDLAIKNALNKQNFYHGDIEKVIAGLTDFGLCVLNNIDLLKQYDELLLLRPNTADVDVSIVDAANAVLVAGDPIEYVLDVYNKMHVGDRETAVVLLMSIAAQSILNSKGIHPNLSGESGKGKSHSCQTILHLVPEEFWVETSLSAKAIFYVNIQPGTVVFSDDTHIGEDLESTIKRATSNFQKTTTHTTIDGNRVAVQLEIPSRITWWLASVDTEMGMQTINRQFGVTVDESDDMDDKVMQHQLHTAVTGELDFPITDEVKICREIMRAIKSGLHTVVIPFAEAIVWAGAQNRRNLPIFLDIVRAFAAMRFMQRVSSSDGVISATVADFEAARDLYCYRAETQSTKLTDVELRLIRVIREHADIDTKTLQAMMDLSQSRVHTLLHGRDGAGGLLAKVPELRCDKIVEKFEERNISKNVYNVEGYDVLGSYDSIVYINKNMVNGYNDTDILMK